MQRSRWSALILAILACVAPACSRTDPKPETLPNLVLITLDTTRADHLGCYGDAEAVTPSLDALAAGGVVFEQAYAPSPLTLPTHATMLTGLNPNEHGLLVNNKASLATDVPTLATILTELGYRSAAFIAAIVLDGKFGLDRGFDVYNDDMGRAIVQTSLVHYRPANVVVDAAIDWLEQGTSPADQSSANHQAPFFMWVHLYDPHQPLNVHADLDGTKFEGEKSYAGEIAFMDRHIGRLRAALAETPSTRRTMIIAVADHGEGLKEHADPTHGMELYEESLRVPLIVSMPGIVRAGHRVDAVVSLRDLLPTVLDVFGLPMLPQSGGRTLKAALEGDSVDSQPSYAEVETPYDLYRWSPMRSFTTAGWKYIRSAQPEIYDRQRDPNEMYNLATVYPQRVADLEGGLSTYEETSRESANTSSVTLSDVDRQRMRDLGYLTGGEEAVDHGLSRDLLNLRDVKDALQLRIYDWTIRWGLDEATVDPATVATVARELLRASPESPGFRNMLESALHDMGQTFDEPAVEPDVEAIRARNQEPEKIVAPFRHDFEDPTKRVKAHLDAGTALAKRGFADVALGHFFEAASLQPDNPMAHLYMAQLFRSLKRMPQTIAHLQKVIDIDPRNAGAQYNLALTYTEAEDYPNAAEHYRKALDAQPDNADARNNLGYVLSRLGKPQEAEELLREALRLKPTLVAAHTNLAQLLVSDRRFAEAIAEYERVLELAPTDSKAIASLAVLLATCEDATLRNPERALQLATFAVETTRRMSPGGLIALARVQASMGHFEAATTTANEAMPRAIFSGREEIVEEIERELERYRMASAAGSRN